MPGLLEDSVKMVFDFLLEKETIAVLLLAHLPSTSLCFCRCFLVYILMEEDYYDMKNHYYYYRVFINALL